MFNRLVWVMAGVAGIGLLTGCDMNRRARTVPLEGIEAAETLAAAPLAIDVENRSGTVIVQVNPKLKRPLVTARPADGRAIRKDDRPWAAAELVTQDERRVLRVLAGGGDPSEQATPIIIAITVPACEGVRIRNSGGPVKLEGVGGAISVTNADLGARTAGITLETRRDLTLPVSLITTAGDVRLTAGPGTSGVVMLTAPQGRTQVSAREADRMGGARNTASGWTGRFGTSDNPISLVTEHGDTVFELR